MYTNCSVKVGDTFPSEKGNIVITDIVLSERGHPVKLRYQNITKKRAIERASKRRK